MEPFGIEENYLVNGEESLVHIYFEECNVCHERFVRFTNLRDHMIKHLSEYPQQCTTCLEVFVSIEELDTHQASKHKVQKNIVLLNDFEEIDDKNFVTFSGKCIYCGLFDFDSFVEFQSHHIDSHIKNNISKVVIRPLSKSELISYGVTNQPSKIKSISDIGSRSGTPDSVSSLSSSGSGPIENLLSPKKVKPLKLKIRVTPGSSEDESQDNNKHFEIISCPMEPGEISFENNIGFKDNHADYTEGNNNTMSCNMDDEMESSSSISAPSYHPSMGTDSYSLPEDAKTVEHNMMEPSVSPISSYNIDTYSAVPEGDGSDSIESGVANYMIQSENSVPQPSSDQYQFSYPIEEHESRQLTLLSGPNSNLSASEGPPASMNSIGNGSGYNYYDCDNLPPNPDAVTAPNELSLESESMHPGPNMLPDQGNPSQENLTDPVSLTDHNHQAHFSSESSGYGPDIFPREPSNSVTNSTNNCPSDIHIDPNDPAVVQNKLASAPNLGQYNCTEGAPNIPAPQSSTDTSLGGGAGATIVPSSIANISNMALSTTSYLAQPSAGQMAQTTLTSVGNMSAPVSVPVTVPIPYRPSTYRCTTAQMSAPLMPTMPTSSRMSYRPMGNPMAQLGYSPRTRMSVMGGVQRMPSTRGMGPVIPNGMNMRGAYPPNMSPMKRMAPPLHTPSKRRSSVSFPSQQTDTDCQIIAVQKRTEGVPVIQNVQGSRPNSAPESTIHLSDSITLSVRPSPEKERPQVHPNHNAGSGGGDATAVASLLATRGITVTPAANAVGGSPVANRVANTPTNSFAVPRTPVNSRVERPPRPPTVDLTHDDNMRNSGSLRGGAGARSVMCQICDRNFSTPEQLNNHMRLHRMNQLPYQCNVCNASFGNQVTLNQHKVQKHGAVQGINETHGIPVVNIAAPGVSQNLSRLGIQGVIPLSNLQNKANGCLGIPILSLNSARNGIGFNLQSAGITNMLTLGPLKPIHK